MFMNLKGNWVVAKGIHPKEAPNAKREDVFEIVALCRKMDGQWGKYVLTTQLRKAIASKNLIQFFIGFSSERIWPLIWFCTSEGQRRIFSDRRQFRIASHS